jgi:DNA topoisomerase-1
VSLSKGFSPTEITLDAALKLLSLPRELGQHPETGKKVTAGIGRFGPYVRHGDTFKSLRQGDDVLTIGLDRALALLAEARQGGRRRPAPLRVLGNHPSDGAPVNLFSGRYGPYVSHDGVNATLPEEISPEAVTLDQALELLAAKANGKGKGKGERKAKAKKNTPSVMKDAKKGPPARAKTGARKKGQIGPTPKAAE